MKKSKRINFFGIMLIVILLAVLAISSAQAATIQGKIYSPDLEPAKKSIVNINSTPKQNLVSNDGTYSFIVPQGTYKIEAFHTLQGTLLYAKETITVPQEGSFTLDLILFETIDIEDIEFDESELKMIEDLLKEKRTNWELIAAIIIVIIVAVLILYFIFKKKKKSKFKPAKKHKRAKFKAKTVAFKEEKLTGDEVMKRTLEILKREHRVNQKDLRKELKISEAKASLIIADLEAQGKVKKIKRGRGNIIIYQE